ncbi:hypothetical protein G6L28_22315 [Agrobacterium larrymoorei]|uniref:hypothetical protein n=1 Tax=Agrobacterium larrymoorei TaxID=160699 RepID=UPI001574D8F7|nr:hypothetical protein [Agrobacterium larrymoorei]NTJ45305.1 hypothetical protein [Agrobacterium larrymoorei]
MLHDPSFAGEGASSPIRLRALSLGAGVPSTTIALMAAHGEIAPMPDCAISADDPEAWADAVIVDQALRTGIRRIHGEVYLHRSCVPLDEADLVTAADHGQLDFWPIE